MSEALETITSDMERTRIIAAIGMATDSLPARTDEAAAILGVPQGELVALLNEPQFIKTLRAVTKANAMLALHGAGVRRLTQIMTGGEDKEAIVAVQILGRLSGDLRAGQTVDVKVSFEELRVRMESQTSPLGDLLGISASDPIDADLIDTDEESSSISG